MSSQESTPGTMDTIPQPTRVFVNSRREAVVIFGAWFVALCWSVPYCYINGYGQQVDPATMSTIMGVPSWLFGGILMPWIIADLFTIWVCFFYMQDDELGMAGDEEGFDGPSRETVEAGGGAA